MAALPIHPVTDRTSGVKVECSISPILWLYCHFCSCSWCLYLACREVWRFEWVHGMNTLTSKNGLSNFPPQKPYAETSSRELLSVIEVEYNIASPDSGYKCGSVHTLWHTSDSSEAMMSLTSLCRMKGNPLLDRRECDPCWSNVQRSTTLVSCEWVSGSRGKGHS